MARPMTVYVAADGTRWDAEQDAVDRDNLCRVIDEAMAPLGARHNAEGNCDYENGQGYVQHDPATVKGVKLALLPITRKIIPKWFDDQIHVHRIAWPDGFLAVNTSWFCRFVEYGPVNEAWERLGCIDTLGREWGQPAFAREPDPAEGQFEIKRGG